MSNLPDNKEKADQLYQEAQELMEKWDWDDLDAIYNFKRMFLESARLGSINAIKKLAERMTFYFRIEGNEQKEIVKLTAQALDNGIGFDYSILLGYLWFEKKWKGHLLHDAVMKWARKEDYDALVALGLFPREPYSWHSSLSNSIASFLMDMEEEPKVIVYLAKYVRYGFCMEKNEEVADILDKRNAETRKWVEKNLEEYRKELEEAGEEDLYDEYQYFPHDIPFIFWGTKEENAIIFDWIKHEAERKGPVQFAFALYLAECIANGYVTVKDTVRATIMLEDLARQGYGPALYKLNCIGEDDMFEAPLSLAEYKKLFDETHNMWDLKHIAFLYHHNIFHEEIGTDIIKIGETGESIDDYSFYQKLYLFAQELRMFYRPEDRGAIIMDTARNGFPPALLLLSHEEDKKIDYEEFQQLRDELMMPYINEQFNIVKEKSDEYDPLGEPPPPMCDICAVPY